MADARAGSWADGRGPGRFLQLQCPVKLSLFWEAILGHLPSPQGFPSWDDGHLQLLWWPVCGQEKLGGHSL